MNQQEFDEVYVALIRLAEKQLQQPIAHIEIQEERSAAPDAVTENKLYTIVTLENGKKMDICVHVFRMGEGMAVRFHGNYIPT